MSWFLGIAGCVRVLLVFNLYHPIRRPGLTNAIGFFVGWLSGELALHLLAFELLLTAGLLWGGALQAWPGQWGLALSLLAWIGLLFHYASGFSAAQIVRSALADAEIPPPPEPAPSELRAKALLRPFAIRRSSVERLKDIEYHSIGHPILHLDLYRSKSDTRPLKPILLQVHGGAWVIGDKNRQGLPLLSRMADAGWLGAAINYRLSPRATFPDPLIDVKRAIAWLRAHAHQYGGDPDHIVITGGSAGAHLASLAALTAHLPQYQPGFEDIDTSVRACVPFYGVYDLSEGGKMMRYALTRLFLEKIFLKARYNEQPELFREASPLHQIHPEAPPFLILHGTCDALASYDDALRFSQQLKATSLQPVAFASLPHAQHAFDIFLSLRSILALAGVADFLNSPLHQRLAPSKEGRDKAAWVDTGFRLR